jgi:hypothetical protein
LAAAERVTSLEVKLNAEAEAIRPERQTSSS